MDQPKFERMLNLLMCLMNNHYDTVETLADRFETSVRTIYRYIDTFRAAGFVIKRRDSDALIYYVDRESPYYQDFNQLLHFTDEESYLINAAINSLEETNLMKQTLKRKLYSVYHYKMIADVVINPRNKENVYNLIDAIENRLAVRLEGYNSAHSNAISDRFVEPFSFTENYVQLWAYEPESDMVKLFKVSRMKKVTLLSEKWQNETKHIKGEADIFRFFSDKSSHIKLQLTVRAANLLMEEYPLSNQYLTKTGKNTWILETDVYGFEALGRFVLGLHKEIVILENDDFKKFVQREVALLNESYQMVETVK